MAQSSVQGQAPGRLSSPEQLNDYLRVTNPRIWMVLSAIVLLLAGLLVWSAFATFETYAPGTAQAANGELIVTFSDQDRAKVVKAGMDIEVGDVTTSVIAVGTDEDGDIVASAQADIPDGSYEARVRYDTTQVISMLLN